jgi:hypothetical protein
LTKVIEKKNWHSKNSIILPLYEVFESKNTATAQGIVDIFGLQPKQRQLVPKLAPSLPKQKKVLQKIVAGRSSSGLREFKVGLQRFRNGKAVFTFITSDLSYPKRT